MSEDEEGREVVNWRTLLPPLCPPLPMLLQHGEDEEEVQVAAVDIRLLQRRPGHMGKIAMSKLGKEELVHGLRMGWLGIWGYAEAVNWASL